MSRTKAFVFGILVTSLLFGGLVPTALARPTRAEMGTQSNPADSRPTLGRHASCSSNRDCKRARICFPPTHTCQPVCQITCLVPDPVCGNDGVTYYCGAYDAFCHGAEVAHEGVCVERACETNAACPDEQICFLPTGACQPPCNIQCLVATPVCGADGRTYACGEIDAFCHGTSVVHPGPCENHCGSDSDCGPGRVCTDEGCEDCVCPTIYDPVCGADGINYSNACEARCAHAEVLHEGPCGQPCSDDTECEEGQVCDRMHCRDCRCPDIYLPVCGADGNTYSNKCEARCARVEIAYEGLCGERCQGDSGCQPGNVCIDGKCRTCLCPDVHFPVCGVDGQTYPNLCAARCAHVEPAHEGACGDPCRADDDCPMGDVCTDGECRPCACPDVQRPVCGVDGRTYANTCEARCTHVETEHEGVCPY